MARIRKSRRQQHGSAWHWKQTDCWYFTPQGTKKREALFDENGERIRGKDNKEAAQLALARIKLSDELTPVVSASSKDWTVAQVCEIYLADISNTASPEWVTLCKAWLNEFCGYCGALTVQELKKKHLRTWLQKHKTWNNNTQRNVTRFGRGDWPPDSQADECLSRSDRMKRFPMKHVRPAFRCVLRQG